ncbi:YicC/YloC family endoribonuclease [Catenovulum adriaticum]|uniref:YicC family protein n=1 Tax=Catenovulum adriaticum TaxID=2984846 RepID=A0ABY7APH6_9ALTE|nr:YicC/YloC family endoribonuclease [Catenovulum sp. TS8]WAJ70151.1 YicC family protein [Catenovulum sp. TS8]
MTIHSMTAFARREKKSEWGTFTWEIRSVNQRYLETYFRLPEQFRALEPVLREKARKSMQRGKLEINLRITDTDKAVGSLSLNQNLVEQLCQHAQQIQKQLPDSQINPVDIMRWPGVMQAQEQDMDAQHAELLAEFDLTIVDFLAARASEGENLKAMIEQRLSAISAQVDIVRSEMPEVLKWQRERIETKLADFKEQVDEARIEQELIMLAQRVDVAEELDRLESHIKETGQKILKKGGACGRRLDFMMQEFNREANTLASKSINTTVTNAAVDVKVLIEQMREQIQNIE